jgi:UDP-glucose 4-epimerase
LEEYELRVLVLGGCGFLGSHIVDELLSQNFKVRIFDRSPEKFRDPIKGVEYVYGDLKQTTLLEESFSDIDAVIHSISSTVPATANDNPVSDIQENLVGSLHVLKSMQLHQVNRLIYLSSGGTVYGPSSKSPILETHPMNPINSYGIVKASVEHYLRMFSEQSDLSYVAIRAANPFGPRQGFARPQGVISTFLARVLRGEPIEIWGDGSVVRDYLRARDIGVLCVNALNSDYIGPVNAGSGVGRSLNQVISAIRAVTGREVKINWTPQRAVDVQSSILDITLAREQFDWNPSQDFEAGILEVWEWIEKHA